MPYWLFLTVLAAIHLVLSIKVFTKEWLLLLFGLQGSVVGVIGAGHTWFISALLICYVFSPVIECLNRKILSLGNRYINGAFILLVSILPVFCALFEDAWVYTLLTPVSIFALACMYGMRYREPGGVRLKRKNIKWAITVAVLALCTRFGAHTLINGTIWYDRVIVPYTHTITAFAIVSVMESIIGNSHAPRIVDFISRISFEIYLYHYIFTAGPLSLFTADSGWLKNCILIFLLVLPIACIGNWGYKFLTQRGKP